MRHYKIYLDMDGVLMDFDGHMRAFGVVDNETHFIHRPREEWTPSQIDLDRRVREVMEREDFWRTMPAMKDGMDLWKFCILCPRTETFVLTATPNQTDTRDRIEVQKRASIDRCFHTDFPQDRIFVCLRSDKKRLAAPDSILVDDMPSNCAEWEKAGGIAILHKNSSSTISHLKRILNMCQEFEGIHAMSGKKTLRDFTSAERKAAPVAGGVLRYFPDALAAIARVSKAGNDKHNPGEPLHWARHKSNDHAECAARHQLQPDTIDPESNETHRAHAGWRLLADLQIAEEKRLIALGIRPLSGVTGESS